MKYNKSPLVVETEDVVDASGYDGCIRVKFKEPFATHDDETEPEGYYHFDKRFQEAQARYETHARYTLGFRYHKDHVFDWQDQQEVWVKYNHETYEEPKGISVRFSRILWAIIHACVRKLMTYYQDDNQLSELLGDLPYNLTLKGEVK